MGSSVRGRRANVQRFVLLPSLSQSREIHQMQEIDCCSTEASCNNLHSPIHSWILGGREEGSGREKKQYIIGADGAGGPLEESCACLAPL